MRYGNAMPQAGRAEAFTGKQAVGDERTRQAVQAFKQQAGLFKGTLLASGINGHQHLGGRQDGGKAVHGSKERIMHRTG